MVKRGWATYFGMGAATLTGIIIPGIGEVASAAEPLGVPPETWVIVGAVLAVCSVLGRMGQAAIKLWRGEDA